MRQAAVTALILVLWLFPMSENIQQFLDDIVGREAQGYLLIGYYIVLATALPISGYVKPGNGWQGAIALFAFCVSGFAFVVKSHMARESSSDCGDSHSVVYPLTLSSIYLSSGFFTLALRTLRAVLSHKRILGATSADDANR